MYQQKFDIKNNRRDVKKRTPMNKTSKMTKTMNKTSKSKNRRSKTTIVTTTREIT